MIRQKSTKLPSGFAVIPLLLVGHLALAWALRIALLGRSGGVIALSELSRNHVVELDEERRAAMVFNLLVVLCSEESTKPVVNTGTLHG